MSKQGSKITAADIRAALTIRYPAESHALMWEVSHAGKQTRYADAVAIGLWSSHGNEIEGMEIKVSRGDWINELKQPEKSQEIFQYCHRFWLVTPKDLIKPEELPSTWGLIEFNGNQLRNKVKAPKLKPIAVTPGFLAAMLRRSAGKDEEMSSRLIKQAVSLRCSEMENRLRDQYQQDAARRVKKAEDAMKKLEQIKEATGIDLEHYTPAEDWIAAMNYLTSHDYRNNFTATSISNLKSQVTRLLGELDKFPVLEDKK